MLRDDNENVRNVGAAKVLAHRKQVAVTKVQITMTTSVARILQWGGGGGFENDIAFDHTLYTGADPESFGGVHVVIANLN